MQCQSRGRHALRWAATIESAWPCRSQAQVIEADRRKHYIEQGRTASQRPDRAAQKMLKHEGRSLNIGKVAGHFPGVPIGMRCAVNPWRDRADIALCVLQRAAAPSLLADLQHCRVAWPMLSEPYRTGAATLSLDVAFQVLLPSRDGVPQPTLCGSSWH